MPPTQIRRLNCLENSHQLLRTNQNRSYGRNGRDRSRRVLGMNYLLRRTHDNHLSKRDEARAVTADRLERLPPLP
jgi:hypothetical protein